MLRRVLPLAFAAFVAACGPTLYMPPKPDPTKAPEYAEGVSKLAALDRQAEEALKRGASKEAADAITKGQPYQTYLLSAPRPTLDAMKAASDLDDIYARMLLAGHEDGWARMFYQKNAARWRTWKPVTAESEARLRQAEAGMAECDRRLKR